MTGTSDDSRHAAELLELLEAEQERAARAIEPDPRLIFAVWGAAWLIGFLGLWASTSAASPVEVSEITAGLGFFVLFVLAVVVTVVHIGRRTAGVRGVSSRVGAMYGWGWFLSFGALSAIMTGTRSQVPLETWSLLWAVLSGLVVGALYLAGGALWQDRVQYGLGVWILVSSAAGGLAGYPHAYLVMALAGGGGFLLAALFFSARGRR